MDWGCVLIPLVFAAFFALIAALVLLPPYMEARSYERVTGRHVSMWDAMWIDLRVQEPTK